jgi:hypothetical protein
MMDKMLLNRAAWQRLSGYGFYIALLGKIARKHCRSGAETMLLFMSLGLQILKNTPIDGMIGCPLSYGQALGTHPGSDATGVRLTLQKGKAAFG